MQEQAQSCQAAVESLLDTDTAEPPARTQRGSSDDAGDAEQAEAGSKSVRFGGAELVSPKAAWACVMWLQLCAVAG